MKSLGLEKKVLLLVSKKNEVLVLVLKKVIYITDLRKGTTSAVKG